MSEYWAEVRPLYCAYEAGLLYPDTQIYQLEIPGGQYSNFKPQVESMGLGHRFEEVKEMYSEVNRMLGDIVKVTPSSKMVGDLALFMVQNNLTQENIVQRGAQLNFPDSVVSYFIGMMGQPEGGFPKDLQETVLKGKKPITCRPGELLPPADMEAIREQLPEDFRDDASVLSSCLYPKVFDEYTGFFHENGDLSGMDTSVFLRGMDPGDSTEFTIENGKTLIIKYIGPGELNANGSQNMVFELNGAQRIVDVMMGEPVVQTSDVELASAGDASQVGASIPGMVSKVMVHEGDRVEKDQVLCVVEAMKMETNVVARKSGEVTKVLGQRGPDRPLRTIDVCRRITIRSVAGSSTGLDFQITIDQKSPPAWQEGFFYGTNLFDFLGPEFETDICQRKYSTPDSKSFWCLFPGTFFEMFSPLALAVRHFPENAPVGAANAFDGAGATVGGCKAGKPKGSHRCRHTA